MQGAEEELWCNFSQNFALVADGKTLYIVVIAFQTLAEQGSTALDAVAACFVHGLTAADVAVNFRAGEGTEMQIRDLGKGFRPIAPYNGAAGHDLVVPAGEQLQHGSCLVFVVGLAQNPALTYHNGIGSDDNIILTAGDRGSLPLTDPGHFVIGSFTGVHGLVNVRNADNEWNAK